MSSEPNDLEGHDRLVLREVLQGMVRDKEIQMRLSGLVPTTGEVLDAVWNSLILNKDVVIETGRSEERLEGDLLILHELIEEFRGRPVPRQERGEGEIEFLQKMAPLITNGIAKRVRKQMQETGTSSTLQAINDEEENVLGNVEQLRVFTSYTDAEIELRKEFLRMYFKGLRNNAGRH